MNQKESSAAGYEFEMSGRAGSYVLEWPSLHISCNVNRFKNFRDGDVKASMRFYTDRPTSSSGFLAGGKVTLESMSSKATMVKGLREMESELDWVKIVEQTCNATLDDYRTGQKEVQLPEIDIKNHIKWVITPGLLQEGNPTLIYGPGNTGKSWIGIWLAVMLDSGESSCGLNVEPQQGKVLYLDWETSEDEIGARVTMVRRGMGLQGPSTIWYRAMSAGLDQDIEAVRNIIIDRGITTVVLDSLGSACMGEPESAEVVLRMFQALRTLKVSSIAIDHVNKEGRLFGSVYKFNASRVIFEARKSQHPDDDRIVFGLFHRKSNNSKLIRDMGFELKFGDDTATFTRKEVRDTPLAEHMRVADQVAAVLRRGAKTVPEIGDELEKSEGHIRKVLSDNSRMFIRLQDNSGRYANAMHEEVTESLTAQGSSWL